MDPPLLQTQFTNCPKTEMRSAGLAQGLTACRVPSQPIVARGGKSPGMPRQDVSAVMFRGLDSANQDGNQNALLHASLCCLYKALGSSNDGGSLRFGINPSGSKVSASVTAWPKATMSITNLVKHFLRQVPTVEDPSFTDVVIYKNMHLTDDAHVCLTRSVIVNVGTIQGDCVPDAGNAICCRPTVAISSVGISFKLISIEAGTIWRLVPPWSRITGDTVVQTCEPLFTIVACAHTVSSERFDAARPALLATGFPISTEADVVCRGRRHLDPLGNRYNNQELQAILKSTFAQYETVRRQGNAERAQRRQAPEKGKKRKGDFCANCVCESCLTQKGESCHKQKHQ